MAEKVFRRDHVNRSNGMITDLHLDSWNDEMFVHSYQTEAHIKRILDQNKAMQNMEQRRKRIRHVGSVPAMVHEMWQREFEKGAHSYVSWDKFVTDRLNSREFAYFKTIPGNV